MILIPMLILQIFLFPLTANVMMSTWESARKNLALEEAASHLGSTVQQVYFLLDHKTVNGTLTKRTDLPMFIESLPYSGNATLKSVLDMTLDPTGGSSKLLEITLWLSETEITSTVQVLLGTNVLWQESTFQSYSQNAGVTATKLPNGTISISFVS